MAQVTTGAFWGSSLRTAKTGAPGRASVVTGACCVGAEQTLANNRSSRSHRGNRSALVRVHRSWLTESCALVCFSWGALALSGVVTGAYCLAPRQPVLPRKLLFRSFLADSSPILFRSARPCFLRVAWSIPLLVSLHESGFARALLLGLNLGL
jgi:hypothetical protein